MAVSPAYGTNTLDQLESEAIYVIREVAAQFERPVMLFSGGKDSIVISYLALKAFHPGTIPFPLMHIDTGHNFEETLAFRDRWVREIGADLIVRTVEESIRRGRVREEEGPVPSRNALQAVTLLDALAEFRFDCAVGGARRTEEKTRAKERFFSFRDRFGRWDPKNQRPEVWNLFNGLHRPGEHIRAFPVSNWTELDVWQYIARERIPVPKLYFSHERDVVERDGVILAAGAHNRPLPGEAVHRYAVRFRTIGDMTCTGATVSTAGTVEEIITEIASTPLTERSARADDKRSAAAMEDRKTEGYF
ncbi:MAG: sulfate adenylyltransferase subunit CysD [Alkalispirochaeta sp.]